MPMQTRQLISDNHSTLEPTIPFSSSSFQDCYDVKSDIGRGRFAVVKHCSHKSEGSEYAAKVIRKRRVGQSSRQRIVQEIAVLELGNGHPNLVKLVEVFESRSEITIVMEYAAGGEMFDQCVMEEAFTEQDCRLMMRQVLEGIRFLHSHNIVHCDIKPQNILLTDPFPRGRVVLCDFGLSRKVNTGDDVREIMGTPDYVAPEVLEYEPITTATDMWLVELFSEYKHNTAFMYWSVGVLTYVMLTGCSPFAGDTQQQTYLNIEKVKLDFPRSLFSRISASAVEFIRQLLSKQPKSRLTVEEAMSHQWVSVACPSGEFYNDFSLSSAESSLAGSSVSTPRSLSENQSITSNGEFSKPSTPDGGPIAKRNKTNTPFKPASVSSPLSRTNLPDRSQPTPETSSPVLLPSPVETKQWSKDTPSFFDAEMNSEAQADKENQRADSRDVDFLEPSLLTSDAPDKNGFQQFRPPSKSKHSRNTNEFSPLGRLTGSREGHVSISRPKFSSLPCSPRLTTPENWSEKDEQEFRDFIRAVKPRSPATQPITKRRLRVLSEFSADEPTSPLALSSYSPNKPSSLNTGVTDLIDNNQQLTISRNEKSAILSPVCVNDNHHLTPQRNCHDAVLMDVDCPASEMTDSRRELPGAKPHIEKTSCQDNTEAVGADTHLSNKRDDRLSPKQRSRYDKHFSAENNNKSKQTPPKSVTKNLPVNYGSSAVATESKVNDHSKTYSKEKELANLGKSSSLPRGVKLRRFFSTSPSKRSAEKTNKSSGPGFGFSLSIKKPNKSKEHPRLQPFPMSGSHDNLLNTAKLSLTPQRNLASSFEMTRSLHTVNTKPTPLSKPTGFQSLSGLKPLGRSCCDLTHGCFRNPVVLPCTKTLAQKLEQSRKAKSVGTLVGPANEIKADSNLIRSRSEAKLDPKEVVLTFYFVARI